MRAQRNDSFVAWLKEKRRTLDLTQEKLAELAGYSARTLEKIESGERRPSRAFVGALAEALGIEPGEHEAFQQFARTGLSAGLSGAQGDSAADAPWRLSRRVPNNLPAERTAFVGREELVASALEMVRRPAVRLSTLIGPPGVGKTRLGLRIAHASMGDFPDGIYFVSLGSVSDPGLVAGAIARSLGVREQGGSLVEQLGSHLASMRLLLVLDNFEQVTGAAPVVTSLLDSAAGLKIVVTSREALRVYGEYVFAVPAMPLPEVSEEFTVASALHYDAVRLFAERALAAANTFRLHAGNVRQVAEICAKLEGLPLAIELAAAWAGLLAPDEILQRLKNRLDLLTGGPRDLPARQQALRGAIEWSYSILPEEERALFERLSVFAGGASREAISQVCGEDSSGWLVEALCNKSLVYSEVREGAERLFMLETLREYAWEKLVEKGEHAAAQQRHLLYFLGVAETASAELSNALGGGWLLRLEVEHDNLRAALRTAIEMGDAEPALRLSGSLWRFWQLRGYPAEGLTWVKAALATAEGAEIELLVLGNAYNAGGNLAWASRDYEQALQLHGRALEIRRSLGDLLRISDSLNNLGNLALALKDYDYARTLYRQCVDICRELGDKGGLASALNNLGLISLARGQYGEVEAQQREALELWKEVGSDFGVGVSMNILGEADRAAGRHDKAYKLYSKALTRFKKAGFKQGIAYTLHNMGQSALGVGKPKEAEAHFEGSLALCRELRYQEGVIRCLAGLACSTALGGKFAQAARLFGSVDRALLRDGAHLEALDSLAYERWKALAGSEMGEAAFGEIYRQGSLLDVERAALLK